MTLETQIDSIAQSILSFVNYGITIIIILLVIEVIKLFHKFTGGRVQEKMSWEGVKDKYNKWGAGRAEGRKKKGVLREAAREETRLLSSLTAEKWLLEKLQRVHKATEAYLAKLGEIVIRKRINNKAEADALRSLFDNLKVVFDDVDKSQRKWKRAERREVREMRRLIKKMNTAGVPDKVQKDLEAREEMILNNYITVKKEIKEAAKVSSQVKIFSDPYVGKNPLTPLPLSPTTKAIAIHKAAMEFAEHIKKAAKAEEEAIKNTASLAEVVKKNWVAS